MPSPQFPFVNTLTLQYVKEQKQLTAFVLFSVAKTLKSEQEQFVSLRVHNDDPLANGGVDQIWREKESESTTLE